MNSFGQGKVTIATCLCCGQEMHGTDYVTRIRKEAERFRFLQNLPVVEAQAFFWNYGSRTERAKAIDKAMHALIEGAHADKA